MYKSTALLSLAGLLLVMSTLKTSPAWAVTSWAVTPIATDVKQANDNAFNHKKALRMSQQAIGNILGDYDVEEASGKVSNLSDFRGKPVLLSLVYSNCYAICPMTTRYLASTVDKVAEALGRDSFHTVIIGFNSKVDTPEAMKYFAEKQGLDDSWHLLSIDADSVDALAQDLGFSYIISSRGFDHIIQASIIDADGKLYQQVYGQTFETQQLGEPLMQLVLGKPQPNKSFINDLVDKVRLFCTTYDPRRDGYRFDYSLFIGMMIGGLIILSITIFLIREILNRKHHPTTRYSRYK